ncbi:chorismate--pyruvate lyase family protein [Massilia glaciei]|uniref:Probable chorismate pyruvate-lyase n=1 Tax=Massilia glaciei TaxID=1524097 RepID=A0A2U2I6L2_9BURK|nr:chorismate lyase [Massilia glaciei]PWF55279.1 chorismate lyase [Massilia glaciei]
MRAASLRQALWHRHVNAVNAPAAMREWLTEGGSLTARLSAHSGAFRVQRLHQHRAMCLPDEARRIGLARPGQAWEREVLLRCDGRPVVFAHTVVPLSASASDWPLFSALGERSLGSTLFKDPQVRRGALEFARIRAGHPLMRRAFVALGGDPHDAGLQDAILHDAMAHHATHQTIYYARRCLYRRHQGALLVTEVFLPPVLGLVAATTNKNEMTL